MFNSSKRYGHDFADIKAGKVVVSYCQRTGKVSHPSRKAAKRHAKHLRRIGTGMGNSVYRCRACDSWHVGHLRRTADVRSKVAV